VIDKLVAVDGKNGRKRKFAIGTSQKRAYSKHRHTAVCDMANPPSPAGFRLDLFKRQLCCNERIW